MQSAICDSCDTLALLVALAAWRCVAERLHTNLVILLAELDLCLRYVL
jgi:hypothetical protein